MGLKLWRMCACWGCQPQINRWTEAGVKEATFKAQPSSHCRVVQMQQFSKESRTGFVSVHADTNVSPTGSH